MLAIGATAEKNGSPVKQNTAQRDAMNSPKSNGNILETTPTKSRLSMAVE